MLTIQQVQEQIKNASSARTAISRATEQELRLKLHCETSLSQTEASRAVTGFFGRVKQLLPADKYTMFLTLFYFPVATVSLTEKIFISLHKLFDGRNPVNKYTFENESDAEDWEQYRTEELNHPQVWATKGFEEMKAAINSIVIVDLPEMSMGPRPEPYWYFLKIDQVIAFSCTDGAQMDWIIFKQPGDRIAVFDDTSYRVFQAKEGGNEINPAPIIDNPHALGYCPARFFWTTPISNSQPAVKKSPVSNYLGKLDMLLFFDISNEHLNLYGRYPIYSAFSQDCDYTEQGTGNYCDDGFLKSPEGFYVTGGGGLHPCPKCSNKNLDGPGSLVKIDPPSKLNDNADLRDPVKITTIDVTSLDYNNGDIDRRKLEIFASITGFQGMPINDQAVNEKQIISIFESLEAALQSPQSNFEQIIRWTEETCCILRYGASFTSASVSLGTEHYILSASELLELYKKARESSFGVATLDMLEDRYYETEYRNNPDQFRRQRILVNLDPFRHRTTEEVRGMFEKGTIDVIDYLIKTNFSSLILRFERENAKVTEFGQGLKFDAKIKAIYEAMKGYAAEMRPVMQSTS